MASTTIDFPPIRFVLAPEPPSGNNERALWVACQSGQATLNKTQVQALFAWLTANQALFT